MGSGPGAYGAARCWEGFQRVGRGRLSGKLAGWGEGRVGKERGSKVGSHVPPRISFRDVHIQRFLGCFFVRGSLPFAGLIFSGSGAVRMG